MTAKAQKQRRPRSQPAARVAGYHRALPPRGEGSPNGSPEEGRLGPPEETAAPVHVATEVIDTPRLVEDARPLDLTERYQVGARIGTGGMAIVYVAHDRATGQQVAIKVICTSLAKRAHIRERFANEVDVLDMCRSPYVLALLGSGTFEERPAYVAELCRGSLYDLAQDHPLELRRVLELVAEALAGLDTVHERGVVHRDLKPSNLLVGYDNRVRIADFGIARHPVRRHTTEGRQVGTPSYTAPDLQLSPESLSPAHDLYALGLTLFTCSSHQRTCMLTMPANREQGLARYPKATRQLIDRATEPDPARRYHHAAEMALAVQHAMEGL